uniref:Cytochrome c oxidase assembly protein COX20, mitochondrial n=1 Tax=Biomphalaria glabrata TaxID=6526 RepID=A0A2C9L4W5_BIOGL
MTMASSSPEEDYTDTNSSKSSKIVDKIKSTPCLKKSLTYGITGGLAVGLTHFLFKSNVSKASNYGVAGYFVFLFGTWSVCRYNLAVQRFQAVQWQKANQKGMSNIELVDPKNV